MEPELTPSDDRAALLGELQHRVRNTLAVMREIVRVSAETSDDLEGYVMHLRGRLDALARVQSAFIRNPMGGIDLGLLVADELATTRETARVDIDGLPIRLHPRAAETIGLALHELVTNACKFGAFSVPSGRVAVTWRTEQHAQGPRLALAWTETGLALPSAAPPRRGFGFAVLLDMVPHNLDAEVDLALLPNGLTYRMALPLTPRTIMRD